MSKKGKRMAASLAKVEPLKEYGLAEAMGLVKETNVARFDASVDLHINLGVDPRKADQAIRGTVVLPHGTGKTKRVLVFCTPEKEQEALDAGADYAGLDDYIQKVTDGWLEFDVIVAMPQVMAKIGRLGRVLGPRGLMPNPKSGTVTPEVGAAVGEVKGGKIAFRVDKYGIIHSPVGRVSFSAEKLVENASELVNTVVKMKPASVKGAYLKTISVASTMSPGIRIDSKDFIR